MSPINKIIYRDITTNNKCGHRIAQTRNTITRDHRKKIKGTHIDITYTNK